ncbi:hypothetical protein BOH78_4930 [Pichia kudriavzevii]|uniref:Uncharacterized protein n=1 Tax=Pichia kudriavzevii TaxID=4909 RepID=A0A1V2LFM5_PICKU|nr:hypothetical protein BOH78_5225 [Pichia kudriavzevii]ONH70830.1 hypothetical protein BOH78_4930 [Pichia kudriavzevii]
MAVEESFRKMAPETSPAFLPKHDFHAQRKERKKTVRKRRQGKGHIKTNCTASAPVSTGTHGQNMITQSSNTAYISWSGLSPGLNPKDDYTLHTGSTLLLTKKVISGGNLSISGYGNFAFEGPDNVCIILYSVSYVLEATGNVISVETITRTAGAYVMFTKLNTKLQSELHLQLGGHTHH